MACLFLPRLCVQQKQTDSRNPPTLPHASPEKCSLSAEPAVEARRLAWAHVPVPVPIEVHSLFVSQHPEWVAEYLLSATVYPSPFSLSALLSYLFPERAQEFYSAHLEPLLAKVNVRAVKPFLAYPTVVVLPAVITGDVLIAFAFSTFFLLTSPTGLALFGLVGLKRYLGGKSA
jgi:hypothetical protein